LGDLKSSECYLKRAELKILWYLLNSLSLFMLTHNLIVNSTISSERDTTLVLRVNLPIWCLVLLLSCSIPIVWAFPIICLSFGNTALNASHLSV
jgi:hypothetical protein